MDLNARRGHDIEMHTKLPPVLCTLCTLSCPCTALAPVLLLPLPCSFSNCLSIRQPLPCSEGIHYNNK